MQIENSHWQQVQSFIESPSIAVVPLGSTEQHAFLSLATDSILATKLAQDCCEGTKVAMFPCLSYGLVPQFAKFPGTVSLKTATYLCVIQDIVHSLFEQGFKKVFLLNGHGGNVPAKAIVQEVLNQFPDHQAQWHDWWIGPQTWAKVSEIDPIASHASWMENFPWTRLPGVQSPAYQKSMVDISRLKQVSDVKAKEMLGDGNFGGSYQHTDDEMQAIWEIAIAETKNLIFNGWAF